MDISIKNELSEIKTLSAELEKYCLAENIAIKPNPDLTPALEEILANITSLGLRVMFMATKKQRQRVEKLSSAVCRIMFMKFLR